MTFSDYAAIAEIVAAIAVVISLVYLAVQVRQSNRVTSAAEGYLGTPGVPEFWADVGPAFSRDFSDWVTGLLQKS